MKKYLTACVLSAVVFAGCSSTTQKPTPQATPSTQKAPNTTLTGTITQTGGKFYITSPGKPPAEIDSYTVKLQEYVTKKVSITGQYSGTTLFVDKVE